MPAAGSLRPTEKENAVVNQPPKNDEIRVDRQRARQGEYGWPMKWVLGAGIAAFAIFGFLAWFYFLGESNQELSPATNGEVPAQSDSTTPTTE